jgi:hypothetical protein
MKRSAALAVIAGAVVIAGTGTAIAVSAATPAYPHSWCGPVIAEIRSSKPPGQYLAGLGTLASQGAPVADLIRDENAYQQDEQGASTDTAASYQDVYGEGPALSRVAADLRQLNSECGQPPDAWKTDNA